MRHTSRFMVLGGLMVLMTAVLLQAADPPEATPVATDQKTTDTEPQTKYELYVSAPGITLLTEYFTLPEVRSPSATLDADLVRSTNVQSNASMIAMRISAHVQEPVPFYSQGILDQDEIAPALAAVDYMVKNVSRIRETNTTYTEIKFSGRGSFVVGFTWDPKSNRADQFIKLGRHFIALQSLDSLQASLKAAKGKVDEVRVGPNR